MPAYLSQKIVYWFNPETKEWRMGAPEHYPAPLGYEKVVCNTAHEAELCSEKMRLWEAMHGEMEDARRELVEGPVRDALRKDILWRAANARNAINRDFLLQHLRKYDNRQERTSHGRISFMHNEGYEHGR